LGLASGFLEPLESTAIHIVYKTLVHFVRYLPDRDFDSHVERLFNDKINMDYQEIRDFIILHYCTSGAMTQRSGAGARTCPCRIRCARRSRCFASGATLSSRRVSFLPVTAGVRYWKG